MWLKGIEGIISLCSTLVSYLVMQWILLRDLTVLLVDDLYFHYLNSLHTQQTRVSAFEGLLLNVQWQSMNILNDVLLLFIVYIVEHVHSLVLSYRLTSGINYVFLLVLLHIAEFFFCFWTFYCLYCNIGTFNTYDSLHFYVVIPQNIHPPNVTETKHWYHFVLGPQYCYLMCLHQVISM